MNSIKLYFLDIKFNFIFPLRCTLLKLLIIYRHKHITCTPITIQDLPVYKLGESFHGDVIVTYKTVLNKS